nr:protein expanded [Leptinotarsa decemlineata]
MRAGLCTVSAPLAACRTAAVLPPSARFLALHLLNQQTLYFIVQAKSRVRELYHQTCRHFAQLGMLDTNLFGLSLICDGEYLFAEPESKLSKYAPKSWRSSHSHGLDANGRPALAFYFRVQFYVDSPLLLRDETTRHHYYLQLRLNAASGAAGDHSTHLAGLTLQADLGDHDENTTFRPEDYVPPNMRGPAALRIIEAAHRTHRGLSKSEARARFIAEACLLQEPVNAHIFRLRAAKSEQAPGSILLAVCPRGLKVSPENNPPSIFLWINIAKLSFERKKFEIRTNHEKLTLYTTSDEKSRLLLGLCRAAHQFNMAVTPRLNEMKRVEEERQRWDGDQRVSVISSTSSNTTSGIVSDRVHSEDELEIMITSPPAPSTESLALAHLLDSAPASSRTSAASATATFATLPLEEEVEEKPTLSESSTKTTSGKCAGSQCSSSCSTIVVTPVQNSEFNLHFMCFIWTLRISDLIVGRYPSCKSVSHTLDSDSDYVTLPSSYQGYIPVPPARIDSVEERFRPPPPPYGAQLNKLPITESTCPEYDDDNSISESLMRSPPPYPDNPTPVPPPMYPYEEAGARFITARPLSALTARASTVSNTSTPSYSIPKILPPIPPKIPKPPKISRPPPQKLNTIVSPSNYLDVAASKASVLVPCTFLPPPPPAPRQPPPPPPPALATVYTSQLSRSQIEQYQQQMYSDVDFVVFPLKEPAISKQEYLEAKQGSLLAALAHQPVFYRSTPYLGRYASSQNLSETYLQLPVYGAPSIASTGSLDPPPPLPPNRPARFIRTRSDDNILNSLDTAQPPKFRRLPPPPPPIPENQSSHLEVHNPPLSDSKRSVSEKTLNGTLTERASALDIRTLREKSKKMDLPLISALCNDRSLIKQTKAFVIPKHSSDVIARHSVSSSVSKYPVTGLSSTINKTSRKASSISHRHPSDKLPEIPRATPNNYVFTDSRVKHKTMQSHS